MAAKTTSCGLLLFSPQRELLLCHAGGARHWDIPKGLAEPGETPRETALRETLEETGLRIAPERLHDLGRHAYLPAKDLHLFAARSERLDLSRCVCSTHFVDRFGRTRPEADAYAWTPFERVAERCAKTMGQVLTQRLSLEAVWRDVMADAG